MRKDREMEAQIRRQKIEDNDNRKKPKLLRAIPLGEELENEIPSKLIFWDGERVKLGRLTRRVVLCQNCALTFVVGLLCPHCGHERTQMDDIEGTPLF